jgi:hypothetical protein
MTELLFSVTDPLGEKISLTRKCWQGHILVVHPVMRRRLTIVRRTVALPEIIFVSRRNADSLLYFRLWPDLPAGNRYLMVVADSRRGYVQTSFPVRDLSKGGTVRWRES